MAERQALATPPAGVTVETGFGLEILEIISEEGLVGVAQTRLVRSILSAPDPSHFE